MHKKAYIENLRVIAMVAVVITHIGSTAATDFPDSYKMTWGGVFYSSIVNIMHFAVPIFFMISGALLLNPAKDIPLNKLIKKYIVKYVGVLFVFGWGYAFIEEIFVNRVVSLSVFLNSWYNMLQGKSWAHMWYMYELVGIMLCVPILRLIARFFEDSERTYIIIVAILFLCILPLISNLSGMKFGVSFAMGNVYWFYMLLGWWIECEQIKIPLRIAKCSIPICMILLILTAYIKVMHSLDLGFAAYSSPIILFYAVSIFSFMKEKNRNVQIISKQRISKTVEKLSFVSFGVYLTHMFWINLLFKLFKINPYNPNVFVGIIFIGSLVLILSIITTLILHKIPIIRKLI